MWILTPDSPTQSLVNLYRYDYLNIEPHEDGRYALVAFTNCGEGTILRISSNLPELKILQNCIESSPRSERFTPTTATLH